MKPSLLIFVCALTCAQGLGIGDIVNLLTKALPCIQETLKDGDPATGLPSLHPIVLPDTTVDLASLNIPAIKGSFEMHDVRIANVVNWDVKKLGPGIGIPIPIHINLDWADVSLDGQYELDASFMNIPLKGSGSVRGLIQSAKINLTLKLKLLPPSIKSVAFQPALSSVELTISELYVGPINIAPIINRLSESVIDWFDEHWDNLIKNFNKYLNNMVQDRMVSTFVDMGGIINGIAEKCL